MSYKIVVANQKGGVAKTTTAVNLADALMFMKYKVLLIDLDPQSNATSVFRRENEKYEKNTVLDVILEKKSIKECIHNTDFGDIVVGDRDLANWDGQLISAPGGTKRIKKAIKDVDNIYDFVIMDTPPNLNASMRNALFAADGIIAPLQAKRFALDGLSDFLDTIDELKSIIKRTSKVLDMKITDEAAEELAKRSRKTPRIANRLFKRVRDFAQVNGLDEIDISITKDSLKRLKVDKYGLDQIDIEYLNSLIDKFNGGPVGVETLASSIGEEISTLEDVVEPYLLQEGFIKRTARGRVVTEKAYNHLGR